MKKIGVILAAWLFAFGLQAQEMSLVEVFETLNSHSKDFSPLMGPVDADDPSVFMSTIEVEEAQQSSFRKVKPNVFGQAEETLEFRATFKMFSEKADLESFVQLLEAQFKVKYPSFRFAQSHVNETVTSWYYRFVLEAADRMSVFGCYLYASKVGSFYHLSFEYPLVKEGHPFREYYYIEQKADTSSFSKAIVNLLAEATQDFVDIRGEEVDDWTYETDYMAPAFTECYIVNTSRESAQFRMPVCRDVDEATMRVKAGEIFRWLTEALGTSYAYGVSSNGMNITFIHKRYPAVPLARIDVAKDADNFSIVVTFFSSRLPLALFFE